MVRPPDPLFADPRLAAIYDDLDGERNDLDHYDEMVDEFGARRVVDVGCGTGTLATRLGSRGIEVVGVDPAAASLDIARTKPGAERVTWRHGDASDLAAANPLRFDLAVMTGNVAQVFVDDEDWARTLRHVRELVRDDGHFVFETRDPTRRAWEAWDTAGTPVSMSTARGQVETWTTVLDVRDPLAAPRVTFRHHFRFGASHDVVTSESTLRFRSTDELATSLHDAGFSIAEVRDAPDRPGLEFVIVAQPR